MRASAASTALMTARPPCRCSSKTSSLVNERGASVSDHSQSGGKSRLDLGEGGRTAEIDGECVVEKLGCLWVDDVAAL